MFRFYKLGLKKRGVVTASYPKEGDALPSGLGAPEVLVEHCDGCRRCVQVCPTSAIKLAGSELSIDLGLCIYCGECARSCPDKIVMSGRFELSSRNRNELEVTYAVRK